MSTKSADLPVSSSAVLTCFHPFDCDQSAYKTHVKLVREQRRLEREEQERRRRREGSSGSSYYSEDEEDRDQHDEQPGAHTTLFESDAF